MPYAELHAKTNFSFLEGASHPDELVSRAAELGYAAIAVTDRASLAGVVRAHLAAKQAGIKLIVGAEITLDDALPLVLWSADRAGYGRLARLITRGRTLAEKGHCRLSFAEVAQGTEGLLAGVRLSCAHFGGKPASSQKSARRFGHGGRDAIDPLAELRRYRELFGDRCYLLAELHYGPDDRRVLEQLVELSRRSGVPLVAAGDVYFHVPQRQALCDVLTAVRLGCTVEEAVGKLFPNAQRYLRPVDESAKIFAAAPDAVARTVEIADRCTFCLDQLRYEYPEELAPPGKTPMEYLAELTWAGAAQRYPHGVPEKVRSLLEHELALIAELRYEAYFLTVWDLVCFARQRGILCQGRGSAANSAVCFCLGITAVDPDRMDLLFERFISRQRNEAPDIDVDFEHQRREEVIQYIYDKYGRDRAGMTAEVITYRPRSAVRDVGKALGLLPEQIDHLAKGIEHFEHEPDLARLCRGSGIDPQSLKGRQLVGLVEQLVGFPRHLSQHTGGMVITRGPLCELVPIENAAMPERTVIQWNKDDLDELGILKVDCLALGMLTAIHKCFDLIRLHYGVPAADNSATLSSARYGPHTGSRPTRDATDNPTPKKPSFDWAAFCAEPSLANIPEGDPQVYEMICRADTMGVFQIESRAQMSMLPRLKPRCFYDLVIEVAIVRPGPIQGDMVHPYLRRRNGEEPVSYPDETIRRVLEKTLGVPLFQEQAMRLAIEAAGFTPGEADQLRRAMGAWRRPGLIDQFRRKLIGGMLARGFSAEYAESVFRQIRGFGDYGFPESHAASFALLVYVSAWLKCHYQAAFTAALLNSQPMGFYAPAQLVRDARRHGVTVLPVDINYSHWDCTLEPLAGEGGKSEHSADRNSAAGVDRDSTSGAAVRRGDREFALRLGFRMLSGFSAADARRIVQARAARPFRSVEELAVRSGLGRAALARLAKAGALGSLVAERRQALWQALAQARTGLPLLDQPLLDQPQLDQPQLDQPLLPASGTDSLEGDLRCNDSPEEASHGGNDAKGTHAAASANPPVALPRMSPAEEVLADYRATGLSLRGHPLGFLRIALQRLGVVPADKLAQWPDGKPVAVAGIVLVRQRPATAKGITFMTLEDETGIANLLVRPKVWQRFRAAAMRATVLLARGRLQRQGEVIHVVAHRLEDLSDRLAELPPHSRDFC